MTLTLDLLRHGQTELGGGFRGSIDDNLTTAGWQQMQTATCGRADWDAVISSPLRRCADFAFELARQLNRPLVLEPAFRELHFGDWEGRSAAELMQDQADALGRFWDDPYTFTPPGAEPLADFESRVLSVLAGLQQQRSGQHLLLVTHGGVMRLLLAKARGLAPQALLQVQVEHAQLSRLRCEPGGVLYECPC
ncbi:histidine phosphatase family protein [Pseudomonas jilinensis]|uniref:Histidine phosphatase family protein n=1 Tax=Pseudomonas jilinensis TaxID=2078689 RepID=A0A396RWA0_9PSED|nr:alpha-ribazole phosphatase family protein [Pseudomonas jilinensis]RHW20874.1 histidine phosphatase family protein [Pseudomonas jilinensis]